MEVLANGISQFRWILLIACVAGFVLFFLSGIFALRDLNRVAFRLERSTVISKSMGSLMRAVLCLLAGGAVYYVTSVISRPQPIIASPQLARMTATPFTIIIPTADLKQAVDVASVIAAATPVTDVLTLPTASLSDASLVTVTATPLITVTSIPQIVIIGAPTLPLVASPTPAPTTTPLVIPSATSAQLPVLPTLPPTDGGTPAGPGATATRPPAGTPVVVALQQLPTPTLAPSETPLAASAPVASACRPAEIMIYKPQANETINGNYDLIGDAVFGSGKYRIDVVPAGETAWRFIFEAFKKVQGESLMPPRFQTSIFPNGAYFMKVTLVDPAGNETGRCIVPFNIGN